jgi:hypothetical protein
MADKYGLVVAGWKFQDGWPISRFGDKSLLECFSVYGREPEMYLASCQWI